MPSSSSRVGRLLAELARALGDVAVRWYLFGAQASIIHGAARLTADVDVTVDLGSTPRAALIAALGRRGFDLPLDDPGFIELTRVIPFVHRSTHMPVDLVLAGPGLEDLFFQRAEPVKIGRATIFVAAPGDVIVMKILAGRPQDLADVEALLVARRDDLDMALIRETLALAESMLDQSDLLPALERMLSRPGAGPRPRAAREVGAGRPRRARKRKD